MPVMPGEPCVCAGSNYNAGTWPHSVSGASVWQAMTQAPSMSTDRNKQKSNRTDRKRKNKQDESKNERASPAVLAMLWDNK